MAHRKIWEKAILVGRNSMQFAGAFSSAFSLSPRNRGFSTFAPGNIMCYGVPYPHREEDWETTGEFIKRQQLLRPVPKDRLIQPRQDQPYLVTESGKRFMWSAAMIPFMSHSNGVSSSGVFRKGAVSVLKPLGVLAVKGFTFKEQLLTKEQIRLDYAEVKFYLISLLNTEKGPDCMKQLPRDLYRWLSLMDAGGQEEEDIPFDPCLLPKECKGQLGLDLFTHLRKAVPMMNGKSSRYDLKRTLESIPEKRLGINWPANVDKNVFIRHWRTFIPGVVQQEKREDGDKVQKKKGMEEGQWTGNAEGKGKTRAGMIEKGKGNKGMAKEEDKANTRTGMVDQNKGNEGMGKEKGKGKMVIGTGMGEEEDEKGKGKKRRRKKKNKDKVEMKGKEKFVTKEEEEEEEESKRYLEIGTSLVQIHRHSYIHVYEWAVMKILKKLSRQQRLSFRKDPYSLSDVLDLLQYEFPEYFQDALCAIKQHMPHLWVKLNVRERFSLPMSLPPSRFAVSLSLPPQVKSDQKQKGAGPGAVHTTANVTTARRTRGV